MEPLYIVTFVVRLIIRRLVNSVSLDAPLYICMFLTQITTSLGESLSILLRLQQPCGSERISMVVSVFVEHVVSLLSFFFFWWGLPICMSNSAFTPSLLSPSPLFLCCFVMLFCCYSCIGIFCYMTHLCKQHLL